MAMEDYFDPYSYNDDEELACERCGSTNVYWKQNAGGDWRLYEDEGAGNLLHSCESASPDDFDEIPE